jgi:hypothetical protein
MAKIIVRNFKPEDVAQISRLDKKYNKVFPDSPVVQAELYLSLSLKMVKMFFVPSTKRAC